MDLKPLRRFEMIELIIPALAGNTRFNFLDIPQLRSDKEKDIAVTSIEAFTVESVPLSFNGNAVTTAANLYKASLTLYNDGEESIFRIPLVKLLAVESGLTTYFGMSGNIQAFDNIMPDWTKSYISTPVAFGNASLFSFVFGVSYLMLPPGTMAAINKARAGALPK